MIKQIKELSYLDLLELIKTEDFHWNGHKLSESDLDLVIDALEEIAINKNFKKLHMVKELFNNRFGEDKRFF